jgi:hypothetical protein
MFMQSYIIYDRTHSLLSFLTQQPIKIKQAVRDIHLHRLLANCHLPNAGEQQND